MDGWIEEHAKRTKNSVCSRAAGPSGIICVLMELQGLQETLSTPDNPCMTHHMVSRVHSDAPPPNSNGHVGRFPTSSWLTIPVCKTQLLMQIQMKGSEWSSA